MFRIDVEDIGGKTETIYVEGEHSILTELENEHIAVNHSCRQGHCGSCILLLLKGDVVHQESMVHLLEGEILACQARPATDIKITQRGY